MNHKEISNNSPSKATIIFKAVVLFIYLIILLFLYYILSTYQTNTWIIIGVLLVTFLFLLGPLFKTRKKSLYKRAFGNLERDENMIPPRFKRNNDSGLKTYEKEEVKGIPRREINLNVKLKKSLIQKCEKCNMIVPNFVFKCPNCGEIIKR